MTATKKKKQRARSAPARQPRASAPAAPTTIVARVDGGTIDLSGRVRRSKTPDARSAKSAKAGKAKSAKTTTKRHRYTAATADRHLLYQLAVQSPKEDIEFATRVYRTVRGARALHYREDFCGTGLLSSYWIQQSKKHTAEGFDIDPDPVAWGLANNYEKLGEDASRYTVHLKDVREPSHKKPDVRVAQNFSYCVFTARAVMLEYFRAVRADLAKRGVFIMDLHGGQEATEEMEEERRCGGFTYVWDQDNFWPGTGEYVCHIHFRFPDGTEKKRAFSYRWRFWHLTELRDILYEAGFKTVDTYFEGTAADGENGNGIFRRGVRGENCPSWLAYLVAYD